MRDEPFSWTSHPGDREGIDVLVLSGPLTLSNIFELQKALPAMKPQGTVIDMAAVPYMDSAGLGVLMNFYVAAEKNGRRVALACTNDRINAILDATRVRDLLRTSASVEQAEEALRRAG